jgi:hypothetical protein
MSPLLIKSLLESWGKKMRYVENMDIPQAPVDLPHMSAYGVVGNL